MSKRDSVNDERRSRARNAYLGGLRSLGAQAARSPDPFSRRLRTARALREQVVPKRKAGIARAPSEKAEVERHHSMSWAKRLKRVFAIEIERCWRSGARAAGSA
jgi:hypothetical protein